MEVINGWGSHQLVLLDVLKRVNKPVLELGIGNYSTKQIHDSLIDRNIEILSLECDADWVRKFLYLKNEKHRFHYYTEENIKDFYQNDNREWGLVFIDNSTWDARVAAIKKYKDVADYIIVHDCDALSTGGWMGRTIAMLDNKHKKKGLRDFSDIFRYWIEFFIDDWPGDHPPTLLGSNKIDLGDIRGIKGMTICNRNK